MRRLLDFFDRHRILFGVDVFLVLYHFVIVNGCSLFRVNRITYGFYSVDFSMGFCSRFIQGAAYRLLVGKYSEGAVSAYVTVIYLLFILGVACLTEKFILAFPDDRKACFILSLFFLTGPFTLSMFVVEFGMLDMHWAILFGLALLFMGNRYLRFLIPLLVGGMVLVHYGSLICYVAALLLLLLFKAVLAGDRRERTAFLVLFGVSLFVGAGLTLYFMQNDKNNVVYSLEQFDGILRNQRGAYPEYYEYYFYEEEMSDTFLQHGFSPSGMFNTSDLIGKIISQIRMTMAFDEIGNYTTVNLLGIIPFAFLSYCLFLYFKARRQPLRRILTLLYFALSLIIVAAGIFFSTDNVRFLDHAIILLFTFLFFLLYTDWREGIRRLGALFAKPGDWFIAVVLFFHMQITADPYTFMR
ncbi:MAG: hypothetical protein IJK02_07715 [Clostridia bacterium]|nr:hypothetical protein [Clostridia bacterium]